MKISKKLASLSSQEFIDVLMVVHSDSLPTNTSYEEDFIEKITGISKYKHTLEPSLSNYLDEVEYLLNRTTKKIFFNSLVSFQEHFVTKAIDIIEEALEGFRVEIVTLNEKYNGL